jgi:Zn-finger nucleic acid-binding protein
MYRSSASSVACPACGTPLTPLATPLPASACASCGGAWLTNETAIHVMRGIGDAQDEELVQTTHAASAHAPSHPPADQPRACPVCASPMTPLVVLGVTVDSCAAHGTWFDRDEVERIASACKKQREAQEAEERDGPPITAEGIVLGAGQVAVGSAKIAFDVFDTLVDFFIRPARPYRRY